MERKIGETFEFEGKKLQVKESEEGSCNFCFFNAECKNRNLHVSGACDGAWREDGKNVIFVEVQEQPQETEEGKERKVGEVFEYEGKKLKVVETEKDSCDNCYFFKDDDCEVSSKECGACLSETRTDNKPVIFVEVKEEPEEQPQPQKLNLCEVLKDCPEGEPFWSPLFGDVTLYDIDQEAKNVIVLTKSEITWYINNDGTITIDKVTSPEIMLYPSREQRDWTKVKYEKKKELPKTWQEFCENYKVRKNECYIEADSTIKEVGENGITDRNRKMDCNLLPSKQAGEAHLALMQLHQLRDAWREGWLPDWKDLNSMKYCIERNRDEYKIEIHRTSQRFLAFKGYEQAKEFINCFIGFLMKAGDLI